MIQEWISVEKKLPVITQEVLINVGTGFVTLGHVSSKYLDESEWRYSNGNIVSSNVTHWMPLPEPPKS